MSARGPVADAGSLIRGLVVTPHVRYAGQRDLEFVAQDGYVSKEIVARKIEALEVMIAENESSPIGYARIEYLWSRLPYIALVRVLPEVRHRGTGRALLGFMEEELHAAGHHFLLSSSQADESEPQEWHRHMGFKECGRLKEVNEGGVDEIFFRKDLGET